MNSSSLLFVLTLLVPGPSRTGADEAEAVTKRRCAWASEGGTVP